MSRLILLMLLIAALVAAATLVATVFSRGPGGRSGPADVPAPRGGVGTLQKAAWALLFLLMAGVGSGMMGAE